MSSPPGTPLICTGSVVASPFGIGIGSVLDGSLMALICAAMSGGTPGCESRYASNSAAVAPVESTVGTRVCRITSVGTWF